MDTPGVHLAHAGAMLLMLLLLAGSETPPLPPGLPPLCPTSLNRRPWSRNTIPSPTKSFAPALERLREAEGCSFPSSPCRAWNCLGRIPSTSQLVHLLLRRSYFCRRQKKAFACRQAVFAGYS